MCEIRLMKEEDIFSVYSMEKKYFSRPWSMQAFAEALEKNNYLYAVATDGKEIIGYCGMYIVCGEGNITQVAVKEENRRCGVGKKLLTCFFEMGKEAGVTDYTLEVRVSNEGAIRLYEANGFVRESVRKNFYDDPVEDAYIMWKR